MPVDIARLQAVVGIDTKEFDAGMGRIGRSIQDHAAQFRAIGLALSGVGATGTVVAKGFVQASWQMERYRAQFRVLTGSIEDADARLRRLVRFASVTPFTLPQVIEADRLIQAFGLDIGGVEKTLRTFGDAASAMGIPMQQAVLAMAKLKAGMFEMQEMAPLGITREKLRSFGVQFKDTGEVINRADLFPAGIKLMQRFAGTMDAVSKTGEGRLSNLSDAWFQFRSTFGTGLGDAAKGLTEQLTGILGTLTAWSEKNPELAGTIGVVGAATAALLVPFGGLVALLPSMVTGLGMVKGALAGLAGPLGLATAGLVAALPLLRSHADDIRQWGSGMADGLRAALVNLGDSIGPDTLTNLLKGKFGSIDWGQVWGALDNLSTSLAEKIKSLDWGATGRAVGDALLAAVGTGLAVGGKLTDVIRRALGAINWTELGKGFAVAAPSFVLGVVGALLDPVTWWTIIKQNWDTILIGVISIIAAPETWVARLGASLARIPLAGRVAVWLMEHIRLGGRAALGAVGDTVKMLAGDLWKGFSGELGRLPKVLPGLRGWLGSVWKAIDDWAVTTVLRAAEWCKQFGRAIAQSGPKAIVDGIRRMFKAADDQAVAWAKRAVAWGKNLVGGIARGVTGNAESLGAALAAAVGAAWARASHAATLPEAKPTQKVRPRIHILGFDDWGGGWGDLGHMAAAAATETEKAVVRVQKALSGTPTGGGGGTGGIGGKKTLPWTEMVRDLRREIATFGAESETPAIRWDLMFGEGAKWPQYVKQAILSLRAEIDRLEQEAARKEVLAGSRDSIHELQGEYRGILAEGGRLNLSTVLLNANFAGLAKRMSQAAEGSGRLAAVSPVIDARAEQLLGTLGTLVGTVQTLGSTSKSAGVLLGLTGRELEKLAKGAAAGDAEMVKAVANLADWASQVDWARVRQENLNNAEQRNDELSRRVAASIKAAADESKVWAESADLLGEALQRDGSEMEAFAYNVNKLLTPKPALPIWMQMGMWAGQAGATIAQAMSTAATKTEESWKNLGGIFAGTLMDMVYGTGRAGSQVVRELSEWEKAGQAVMDDIRVDFEDTLVGIIDGTKSLGDLWSAIWQDMTRVAVHSITTTLLSAERMNSFFANLFGGQKGGGDLVGSLAGLMGSIGSSTPTPSLGMSADRFATIAGPFAKGGSFTVGGGGGTDSQWVGFRATPGERVTVETPQQQAQGKSVTIHQTFVVQTPDAQSFRLSQRELLRRGMQAAMAGAGG